MALSDYGWKQKNLAPILQSYQQSVMREFDANGNENGYFIAYSAGVFDRSGRVNP